MDPKFFRKYSDIIAEADIPVATADPDQVLRDKTIFAINFIKRAIGMGFLKKYGGLETIDRQVQDLTKYFKGVKNKRLLTAIRSLQNTFKIIIQSRRVLARGGLGGPSIDWIIDNLNYSIAEVEKEL
jgi:hypothetical protein